MTKTSAKVRDVMSAPAITVREDATSAEIVECLLANDISGVPVVDDDGHVTGIVTEADLVLSIAHGDKDRRALMLVAEIIQGSPAPWIRKVSECCARDLMTTDVVTISPDDDVDAAARLMLRKPCKRLPVVSEGKIVGVISRHDIVCHFETASRSSTL